MSRVVLFVCAYLLCYCHSVFGFSQRGFSNRSAIVVRLSDKAILVDKGADKRVLPASLTKIVTVYTALREISKGEVSLYDFATISRDASLQPPSKIGLRSGSHVSVINLLLATFVVSANDAALSIADKIGGVCDFVEKMNATLPSINMHNSRFANPTGLDEWVCVDGQLRSSLPNGHIISSVSHPNASVVDGYTDGFLYYTTPRDVVNGLLRLATDFPEFADFFRMPYFVWRGAVYSSTNNVARYLKGTLIGKTGHTSAAGYNLAASISVGKGDGLIAVVTGMSSRLERDDYIFRLLDFGAMGSLREGRAVLPLDVPSRFATDRISLFSSFGSWLVSSLGLPLNPAFRKDGGALPSVAGRVLGVIKSSRDSSIEAEDHFDAMEAQPSNCWLGAKVALKRWFLANTAVPTVGLIAAHNIGQEADV